MIVRPCELVDRAQEPPALVAAEVVRDCPATLLDTIEVDWGPLRIELREAFSSEGHFAEHSHWDWRRKRDSVASGRHRVVAIRFGKDVQGVMAVFGFGRTSKIDPSNDVIYIDCLESAPNNIRRIPNRPHFAPIGLLLIFEAIRLSQDMGFAGRVGLHSLPQAESFYRDRIGCIDLGTDPRYHNLRYFEITERLAGVLLKE